MKTVQMQPMCKFSASAERNMEKQTTHPTPQMHWKSRHDEKNHSEMQKRR